MLMWTKYIVLVLFVATVVVINATPQVFIGGGDNPAGAFNGYLSDPEGWPYVRANANGYYVNNFVLSPNETDSNQFAILQKLASLFANKNVFYESDLIHTTDGDDKAKIDILRQFWDVTLTALNYGFSASRIEALQWRAWRPVLAMEGPWTIDGDINSAAGAPEKSGIDHTSGSATDGPLGLWAKNTGQMQQGDYSMIRYSRSQGKLAMVMLATYTSESGNNYLSYGQSCVQGHENNNLIPDIWALSYYAAQLEVYPVTPEQVNGAPAGTVTGLAYWLIRHLHGKSKLIFDTDEGVTVDDTGSFNVAVSGARNITVKVAHDDDAWLDVIPQLQTTITDRKNHWKFEFFLNDKLIENFSDIKFVGNLRMWGGDIHTLSISIKPTSNVAEPSSILLQLKNYPTESTKFVQKIHILASLK